MSVKSDFVFDFGFRYVLPFAQDMDPRLTPKQNKLLAFIRDYSTTRSYPPSLREMADYMDIRALSTVHQHLQAIKAKGLLAQSGRRERNIEFDRRPRLVSIPLLGTIAAGLPIEPIEDPEPFFVSTDLIKTASNHYALRVRGDSMIDDGIHSGDVVVIRSQHYIDHIGQTVVAITDNEATLKRFGGVDAYGRVRLLPRNPRMEPMLVDVASFQVRGIMVGLIRSI